MSQQTERAKIWASTMHGHGQNERVVAHADSARRISLSRPVLRAEREEIENAMLIPEAAHARGAGDRERPEEPDRDRTCFERDRDRIVHSTAFRRLAGKTQVVVHPTDHQRTRLTHALEVAQVARSVARGLGVNVTLADAIALGHDCGHGPGGHASEDAFDPFISGGYHHGPWGSDVVLTPLNLCFETLDGIRNHSWSRPAAATVEGEIVSWADRIAYCAHDLEDAAHAGIVDLNDLPAEVVEVCGRTRRQQIGTFVHALTDTSVARGEIAMDPVNAGALAALRAFNYEHIYTRPESIAQADAVIDALRGLVEYFVEHPTQLPGVSERAAAAAEPEQRARAAVTYVGGMTDRFAFEAATELLGFGPERVPQGIGRGA